MRDVTSVGIRANLLSKVTSTLSKSLKANVNDHHITNLYIVGFYKGLNMCCFNCFVNEHYFYRNAHKPYGKFFIREIKQIYH
jgi:hypothetical protein